MKTDQILQRLKKMKMLLRPFSLNEELGLTTVREISITIGRLGSLITLLESLPDYDQLNRNIIDVLSEPLAIAEDKPGDVDAVFELRLAIISAQKKIGHFLPQSTGFEEAASGYMSLEAEADFDLEAGVDEAQKNDDASGIDPEKPWPR